MKNKLLNFTICQALIIIGMSLLCVKCQEQKLSAAENVTVYDRSFHRVLSRRKRFLLWRPGSNILLTGSLVKPLAFRRPTGHNLILEWDIFYPLPNSWRVPKKPAPKPPPHTTELPIEPVESWTPPKEVWQPEGGWTNDVIQQINNENKNMASSRRNWQPPIKQTASNQHKFMDRNWNENNLFKSISVAQPPPPVSLKLNPLLFKSPWQQTQLNRNHFNFNQRYFQSNQLPSSSSLLSSAPKSLYFSSNANKAQSSLRNTRSLAENILRQSSDEEFEEDWEHYYAHRDRRDLYERIENASPIVPIKDDMDDDYSNAMRANDQDCVEFYSKTCPVSVLALLLHAQTG